MFVYIDLSVSKALNRCERFYIEKREKESMKPILVLLAFMLLSGCSLDVNEAVETEQIPAEESLEKTEVICVDRSQNGLCSLKYQGISGGIIIPDTFCSDTQEVCANHTIIDNNRTTYSIYDTDQPASFVSRTLFSASGTPMISVGNSFVFETADSYWWIGEDKKVYSIASDSSSFREVLKSTGISVPNMKKIVWWPMELNHGANTYQLEKVLGWGSGSMDAVRIETEAEFLNLKYYADEQLSMDIYLTDHNTSKERIFSSVTNHELNGWSYEPLALSSENVIFVLTHNRTLDQQRDGYFFINSLYADTFRITVQETDSVSAYAFAFNDFMSLLPVNSSVS